MIVFVEGPEQMEAVNAADNLFCRFRMEGCPYCTNTQADWDDMCADVESKLAPGTVIAEIESKLAPLLNAKTAVGTNYSVNQFPTYSFFKKGVFKGEVKNARKKGELLTVLKKRRFLKKRGTRMRKPFRKTRKF